MNPADERAHSAASVLASIHSRGVKIWLENGRLRYRAPKGALTRADLECLRAVQGDIAALLETSTVHGANMTNIGRRSELEYAPLTFQQLAHWNLYRLRERSAIRQIASALRLRGPLNRSALQSAVGTLVARHEALRTTVVVRDGDPVQLISPSATCELKLVDLTSLPENRCELEVERLIVELILEPIDVAIGPLFGARLLRVGADEHVLVLALEHMVSDAFSMGILLRELFTVYAQAEHGEAISLVPVVVQFPDYAAWQREGKRAWMGRHGAYWRQRLAGCGRLRFPADRNVPAAACRGWAHVPVHINKRMKMELIERCRQLRTTLAMGVFSAYVALVLRWCEATDAVILFQIDGRLTPELQNTIGYMSCALNLRIALHPEDTFVDLLNRAIQEYCVAYEHADSSLLEAQTPAPEFAHNGRFNWIPQSAAHWDATGSGCALSCSPVSFAHPLRRYLVRDGEPSIQLFETDDEIAGELLFPRDRFAVERMEKLMHRFIEFLQAFLSNPAQSVNAIPVSR